METGLQTEIDEIIAYMHRHLYDPLPLSRLAAYAAYSPYHFSRLFKKRTGLSPLYYVSALRLQKAKDLLLRTHLSVRDIGLEIGQQSLGTFTTRFTERVGVTPAQFRNSRQQAANSIQTLGQLNNWLTGPTLIKAAPGCVCGTVRAQLPFSGVVLIGLFPKPIPENFPLYGTLLPGPGDFCFNGVRPGCYYLMATSVAWGTDAIDMLLPHRTLRTRSHEPIIVSPGRPVPPLDVMLHPPRQDDPPILISLPALMNRFIGSASRSEETRG